MKDIKRLLGYTAATIAMIAVLIGIAQMGVSSDLLAYAAIFIVVVLPIAIGVVVAKREKRDA